MLALRSPATLGNPQLVAMRLSAYRESAAAAYDLLQPMFPIGTVIRRGATYPGIMVGAGSEDIADIIRAARHDDPVAVNTRWRCVRRRHSTSPPARYARIRGGARHPGKSAPAHLDRQLQQVSLRLRQQPSPARAQHQHMLG